jgi:hypothetical protein
MSTKSVVTNGRPEAVNGHRSPDARDVSFKLGTPVPAEVDTPGGRDYDSQRQSRNSMLTPGDRISEKRFTGKSTLKNPFGYVRIISF